MKTFPSNFSIFSLALVLFLFLGLTNTVYAQEGAPKLSPDQFEKEAKKKKRHVILDVRTPEEVAEGHIEDSQFADFLGDNFEEDLSKLNKKRTYYVYCRSAKRTIPATEKMKEMGFKKVYMLEGGLNNWIDAGKPLVKTP